MRRIFIITTLLIISLATSGCGFGFGNRVIRGSGNVVSERREVSGFDRVTIEGAGELILTQGETESLEIEAEDNIITEITSEVNNGTLVISFRDDFGDETLIPTEKIKFYLSVIEITELNISGAALVNSDSLKSDRFDLDIDGAADINIDSLTADTLEVDVNGGARCDLSGKVSDLLVTVDGAGSFDAEDLESADCEITINGAAEARIWVTENLDVNIDGVGSLSYYGNPRVSQDIDGLGSVTSLGSK